MLNQIELVKFADSCLYFVFDSVFEGFASEKFIDHIELSRI